MTDCFNKLQESDDLINFEQCLPVALLRAREAVMRQLTPILRSHDVSPEQWRVIRALKLYGPQELAKLSRNCFLLAPSISRIAQNLEKRDLVSRKSVESDHRRSELALTPQGAFLFDTVAPQAVAQHLEINKSLGAEKLILLHELLNDLVDSLQQ